MSIRLWMTLACVFGMLLGCGSGETTATGGAGGATVSASSNGGSGGQPQTTSGTGAGGPFLPDKIPVAMTANDVAVALDQGKCSVVAPLSTEDGSYTRVVAHVFGGSYQAIRFAAIESVNFIVPDPWTIGVGIVPAGLDPSASDCEQNPVPHDILSADSVSGVDPNGDTATVHILRAAITPGTQDTGAAMVVCIRNGASEKTTALVMCGEKGSGDPDRDQWQDSADDGGAIHTMCSYGESFCRTWMVEPEPVPQ